MATLDEKDDLILKAEELFAKQLNDIDNNLAREIIKLYAQFVVGDTLLLDAAKLAQIEDAIITAVAKTGYGKSVEAYIRNFDAIKDMNDLIHRRVNGVNINQVVNENERIFNFISSVTSQLKGTPSTIIKVVDVVDGQRVVRSVPVRNASLNELIQPIANLIRKDVITGVSFRTATEQMLDAIKRKEIGLEAWAGQIGRDALSQADGVINEEVKREFKMKYARYTGTIKETTRPVCYHLLTAKSDPVYTDEEIAEVLGEYAPGGIPSTSRITYAPLGKSRRAEKGAGIIPGTTVQNFPIYRGGYRCEHRFLPLVKKSNSEKVN